MNGNYMVMKKAIFTVFTLIWMILIFSFSAKPADESTDMSLSAGKVVGTLFIKDFDNWNQKKQDNFAQKIDYPVRKMAHATEYMVLGLLLMGTLTSYGLTGRKRWLASLLTGILYATSDELHQLFVPGRSGQLTDVLIDSSGVICGIIFFVCICKLVNYHKKKNIANCI